MRRWRVDEITSPAVCTGKRNDTTLRVPFSANPTSFAQLGRGTNNPHFTDQRTTLHTSAHIRPE